MRKGYVTIYFAIVLAVCMSLFLGLIYSVRENALRMRSKEAADISMNSVFAEFVITLWEDYGLLFVDAGYNSKARSMILTEDRFRDCMNENFDEKADVPVLGKDLLKLECTSTETMNVRFATDDSGLAIRRQAVEYMHYHTNASYVEDLYNAISDINDFEYSGVGLSEQVNSAMAKLQRYDEEYEITEWTDKVTGAIISDGPVSPVTILSLVAPSLSDISGKELDTSVCVSHRDLNAGNYAKADELGITDTLLFKEYLIEKCADYVRQDPETSLSYEIEYLINGNSKDARNLAGIVHRILLIREAANYEQITNDPTKMGTLRFIAGVIALILLDPEITEPLARIIAAGWAYYESIKDVRVLLRGGRVPLLKDAGDFYTNLFGGDTGVVDSDKGLSYQDYLRAFVMASGSGKLTERFMDLLEIDVRKKDGNNNFRLDFCFDALAIRAFVTSKYGYDYVLERTKEL